jgi:hypothetical protein
LKFIWRRLILLFILGFIALALITPIHELGHALFATALGAKVTNLYLGPFGGYAGWDGIWGVSQKIAVAGGIILTLLIGLILLFAYRRKMFFELSFFSFILLTGLLFSGISYMLGNSLNYLISGPNFRGDVILLIQLGVPAPIFLIVGVFLAWLVLFPMRYIEHLTFLYGDTIDYVTKDIKIKIKKR